MGKGEVLGNGIQWVGEGLILNGPPKFAKLCGTRWGKQLVNVAIISNNSDGCCALMFNRTIKICYAGSYSTIYRVHGYYSLPMTSRDTSCQGISHFYKMEFFRRQDMCCTKGSRVSERNQSHSYTSCFCLSDRCNGVRSESMTERRRHRGGYLPVVALLSASILTFVVPINIDSAT